MLRTLELKDFAIIEEVELELTEGLNVLTGETGAGKSIVVDALDLLTGGRAGSNMIRTGATSALVQATFAASPLESCSRRLSSSGRHTARIDGELVTVGELAERVGALASVFAQHAAQELLSRTAQRAQLDRLLSGHAQAAKNRYVTAFTRAQVVEAELAELHVKERERARRADTLAHQIAEIDAVAPQVGEGTSLRAELTTLQHAEGLLSAAVTAHAALSGDSGPSAITLTAEALQELEAAGKHAQEFLVLAEDLRDSLRGVSAVAAEVEQFLSSFTADPERLDAVQARLAQLQELERKYGPDLKNVLAFRQEATTELASLSGVDQQIAELDVELTSLRAELRELGMELTAARVEAASRLATEVTPLLTRLGMPNARFSAEVHASSRAHRYGHDDVRFVFSANPGEELRPLAEVGSGGELSRVMLALNLVTGSELPTLAFDEVDAGIGGVAATHVAALLARLAEDHQVIVVTHLAQVAAHADAHFVVEKSEQGGRTLTRVRRVREVEREAELARMLAGETSEAALQHARELLRGAAEGARTTSLT